MAEVLASGLIDLELRKKIDRFVDKQIQFSDSTLSKGTILTGSINMAASASGENRFLAVGHIKSDLAYLLYRGIENE